MISHQAVCENLKPMLAGILLKQFQVPLSVRTIKEDILSSIAPLSNMMRNTSENRSLAILGTDR